MNAIDKTMTIDDLRAALDECPTLYPPDDVREVLTEILYAAGTFYNYRTMSSHAGACWRALDLAAYLVRADGIDEKVAIEITDELGAIVCFAFAMDGLSDGTRARLWQIMEIADAGAGRPAGDDAGAVDTAA